MGLEEQAGKTAGDSGDPQLVEVEVDGKKVMVSAEGKDYLLRQADYSRKTAELAEERRAIESLKKENETAKAFLNALASNEEAAQLMEAVLTGDKDLIKSVASKSGEEEDKTAKLEKELEALKRQISTQTAMSFDEKKRNAEYASAKKILNEEYGLDLDALFPHMQEIATGTEEKKNRFVTLGVRAALPELIKRAKEEGKNEGREEALNEFVQKSDNTPTFSSGSGTTPPKGVAKTRDAGMEAFHDLLKKGATTG